MPEILQNSEQAPPSPPLDVGIVSRNFGEGALVPNCPGIQNSGSTWKLQILRLWVGSARSVFYGRSNAFNEPVKGVGLRIKQMRRVLRRTVGVALSLERWDCTGVWKGQEEQAMNFGKFLIFAKKCLGKPECRRYSVHVVYYLRSYLVSVTFQCAWMFFWGHAFLKPNIQFILRMFNRAWLNHWCHFYLYLKEK